MCLKHKQKVNETYCFSHRTNLNKDCDCTVSRSLINSVHKGSIFNSVHKGSIFNMLALRQFHIALTMCCLTNSWFLYICLFVYLFINPRKRYSKVTSNTGIVITPQTIQLWWMTYALKTWYKVVILWSYLTSSLNLDLF